MRTRAADRATGAEPVHHLATTLGALGWIWACAASAYLLAATDGAGIWSSSMFAAGGEGMDGPLPSLGTATGVWIATLLTGVTLVAGIPVGVTLTYPADGRRAAWAAGLGLLAFSLSVRPSLGLVYLPSAMLLMATAAVGELEVALVRDRHLS